jgi:hypothetical protein
MQIPPIAVILSWPAPNYSSPITRGNTLLVLLLVFSLLVLASVLLRFYSRLFVKRWYGYDDAFIGIALVSASRRPARPATRHD